MGLQSKFLGIVLIAVVVIASLLPITANAQQQPSTSTIAVSENSSTLSKLPNSRKCLDPGKCFAESVCYRIRALCKAANLSRAPKLVSNSVRKALELCKLALRARDGKAFELAMRAAKVFSIAAPYVIKHVNKSALATFEIKMVERAIAIRMEVIKELKAVALRLEKINATKEIALEIMKAINEAEKALRRALAFARNGSVIKAEEELALATKIIAYASRLVNGLVARASLTIHIALHHVATATRAIIMARKALALFNATNNTQLLTVAHRALEVAMTKLKFLGERLESLGFVNASRAVESVLRNLSLVDNLVKEAASYAKAGDIGKAKEVVNQALRHLDEILANAKKYVAKPRVATLPIIKRVRVGVAKCLADEIGSVVMAKDMLMWIAKHAKNPVARLKAALALMILGQYISKVFPPHPHPQPLAKNVPTPPHLYPCKWHRGKPLHAPHYPPLKP